MKFLANVLSWSRGSKRILHFFVFAICISVSVYQLIECFKKLRHPPISTRYHFVINDTLHYPALTICRNPPYKLEVLKYYNLSHLNSSIEHTSVWQNFPFNVSLKQIWENATYSQKEVVALHGLIGNETNVEIVENFFFFNGRCFTFKPRVGSTQPGNNFGWSISLRHDYSNTSHLIKRRSFSFDTEIKGFHVYIHEVREPWTENDLQTKFLMQYLFVEVGEELEVKINAESFNRLSTIRQPCTTDINYSLYECIEGHYWMNISKSVGCTVPWMRKVVALPFCNKYEPLKALIKAYMGFSDMNDKRCAPSACNTTIFRHSIVKRTSILKPFSHIYVYYSSKMSTVMQESLGYDANAFLADLGGSLGFFLGLSVIGFIGLIEKIFNLVMCYTKPTKSLVNETGDNKNILDVKI